MFLGVTLCCCCAIISTVRSGSGGLPLLSQVSRQLPIRLNGMNQSVSLVCCMECVFVFSQACVHVCECVCKQNKISVLRVCVCLTFVLWLAIAGNPSTSQSKKTIKQRFLKLLPCCKPSAAPSISQSKCSFTLFSLFSPVFPASLVN